MMINFNSLFIFILDTDMPDMPMPTGYKKNFLQDEKDQRIVIKKIKKNNKINILTKKWKIV